MPSEKMNSANLLQLIRETTPGVYNVNGDRLVMTCLRGDYAPEEAWASFRPSGFNEDGWHALERTHSVWSGTIRWDFKQAPTLLRMLCGAPVSDVTENGKRTRVFTLPEMGARDLDGSTYSFEYGTPDDCDRCTYGMILSIALPAERASETVEGQITMICRKPEAEGVPMTGSGAGQPDIFSVTFNAVNGTRNITLKKADGTTAGVLAIAPGATADSLQTAIRAFGAPYANATVTGSTTSTAGTDVTTPGQFTGVAGDLTDNNPATSAGWGGASENYADFDLGTPTTLTGIKLTIAPWPGDSGPGELRIYGKATPFSGATAGGGTLVKAFTDLSPWNEAGETRTLNFDAPVNYRYYRYFATAASSAVTFETKELELLGVGASNGTYSINTQTNAFLPVPTNGNNDVTIARTQAGSDGTFTIPARVPMLNRNFSMRRGESSGLVEAAAPLNKAMMKSFELGGLVDPIWFFDENEDTFGSHVDGPEPSRTLAVRLAKTSSDLPAVTTDAKSQPAKPSWWQMRAVHADDSDYSFRAEFFASATGAISLGAGGNVRYVEFPLATVIHGEGSAVRFVVTEPA